MKALFLCRSMGEVSNFFVMGVNFMNKELKKITFSGVMISLAYLLPFITVGNTELGNMLSLMHLPVMLCGFVCGWQYGLVVGACTPMLRHLLLTKPPIDKAIPMAFELAAYGAVCGLVYNILSKKFSSGKGSFPSACISLVIAMIVGRVVHALVKFTLVKLALFPNLNKFGLGVYILDSVLPAWPAMVLQLALLPILVLALEKAGFMLRQSK